jgi:hypothetical protein
LTDTLRKDKLGPLDHKIVLETCFDRESSSDALIGRLVLEIIQGAAARQRSEPPTILATSNDTVFLDHAELQNRKLHDELQEA